MSGTHTGIGGGRLAGLEGGRLGGAPTEFRPFAPAPPEPACRVGTMDVLGRKLASVSPLSADDRRMIRELSAMRAFAPVGADLIHDDGGVGQARVVLSGWACRYTALAEGRHQITAFLLPGDFCNSGDSRAGGADQTVGALSRVTIADVPRRALRDLVAQSPAVAMALWRQSQVEQAVLRRWIVNLGALSATERVAHLFCELWTRLNLIGLADGPSFDMPLTQVTLADTMGLSAVHMNRVLQQLREDRLIILNRRSLTLLDQRRLRALAGFHPDYLQAQIA
jgi:CRP-like cAMP-binding protein